MTEVRLDPRKVTTDPAERAKADRVAAEVRAGNLVFRGYDHGVAVYGKVYKEVRDEHH